MLGIVLRNDLSAEDGINAELITTYFDRVYVASHVDITALREELGEGYSAERIVAMTGKAPESGSYMIGYVIGPVVAPPESKAIPIKLFGAIKANTNRIV